jgi:hypothetical protein
VIDYFGFFINEDDNAACVDLFILMELGDMSLKKFIEESKKAQKRISFSDYELILHCLIHGLYHLEKSRIAQR